MPDRLLDLGPEKTLEFAESASLTDLLEQSELIESLGQATIVWSVLGHRSHEALNLRTQEAVISERARLATVINDRYGRPGQQGENPVE